MTTNETLITATLAQLLHRQAETLNPGTQLADLGLDSLTAVRLLNQLEQRLGRELDPMIVLDCPCVASMAAELDRLEAAQELALQN